MKIVINDVEKEAGIETWQDAISFASSKMYEKGYVSKEFGEHCIEREKIYPTGLETEFPVAIPHTEAEFVNETAISVLRLKKPVVFQNMAEPEKSVAVHYVFNLAIKEKHNQVVFLSKVIGLVQDSEKLEKMFEIGKEEFNEEFLKMME